MGCGACSAVTPIEPTPAPKIKPGKLAPIVSKPEKKKYHFIKIMVTAAKPSDQTNTLDTTEILERTVYDVTEEMENGWMGVELKRK